MNVARVIAAIDALEAVASVRAKTKAVTPLETKLAKALRLAFKQQEAELLKRFAKLESAFETTESATIALAQLDPQHIGYDLWHGRFTDIKEAAEPRWESLFDAAMLATIQAFEIPLSEFIQLALAAGARHSLATFSIDTAFDLKNPRAVEYLKDYAADLVKGINDVTREDVRRIIVDAVDSGKSYTQVAKELRDKYAEFAAPKPQAHIRDRATLIAVTEIGNGYEAGNAIVVADLQDGGIEMESSWLTVGDANVSDGCAENQAAGWIEAGTEFPSGHTRPLRFPGCRCTLLSRRKGAGA